MNNNRQYKRTINRRDFLKLLGVGTVALGGGAFLSSCGQALTSVPTSGPTSAPTAIPPTATATLKPNYKVRTPVIASLDFDAAPILYALENGMFTENGINFEVIETGSGEAVSNQALQLLLANHVDFGNLNFPDGFFPVLDGAPLKGLGQFTVNGRPDYWMIVKKDIQTWKDLEGKKYVVSGAGSPPSAIGRYAMKQAGVNVDLVEFVPLGGSSARTQALLAGQVDAALIHPLNAIPLLASNPNFRSLGNVGKDFPMIFSVEATMADTIAQNRGMVVAYVKTNVQAVRLFLSDRELAVDYYISKVPDADRDLMNQVWQIYNDLQVWDANGGIDNKALFEASMNAYVDDTGLPQAVSWDSFMDISILEDVIADIGKI